MRSKRAKRPRAPEPEPQQDLENEYNGSQEEKDINEIAGNFLSPSVREYLELGKSIPGKSDTYTDTHTDTVDLKLHCKKKMRFFNYFNECKNLVAVTGGATRKFIY